MTMVTNYISLANKDKKKKKKKKSWTIFYLTATGEHKHCVLSLELVTDLVISYYGTIEIKAILSMFALNQD